MGIQKNNSSNCQLIDGGDIPPVKIQQATASQASRQAGRYERLRRLFAALALIRASDMSMAAVARLCGYSSQQALCRDVKSFTSFTPLQYRTSGEMHFLEEDEGRLYTVRVAELGVPRTLRLRFYYGCLRDIENIAARNFLDACPNYGGRLLGRLGEMRGDTYCYELFAENISQAELLGGYFEVCGIVPASTLYCATISAKNNVSNLCRSRRYLCGRWFESELFRGAGEPLLEEFLLAGNRVTNIRISLPLISEQSMSPIYIKSCPAVNFIFERADKTVSEFHSFGRMMGYLSENYPALHRTAQRFYLSQGGVRRLYGAKTQNPVRLPGGSEICCGTAGDGLYALMPGVRDDTRSSCERILNRWLHLSGFGHEQMYSLCCPDHGNEALGEYIYCRIKPLP